MSSKKFSRLLALGNATIVRQRGTSHAVFEREKGGRVYRAPVIMAKAELSFSLYETCSASVRIFR